MDNIWFAKFLLWKLHVLTVEISKDMKQKNKFVRGGGAISTDQHDICQMCRQERVHPSGGPHQVGLRIEHGGTQWTCSRVHVIEENKLIKVIWGGKKTSKFAKKFNSIDQLS